MTGRQRTAPLPQKTELWPVEGHASRRQPGTCCVKRFSGSERTNSRYDLAGT